MWGLPQAVKWAASSVGMKAAAMVGDTVVVRADLTAVEMAARMVCLLADNSVEMKAVNWVGTTVGQKAAVSADLMAAN